MKANFNRSSLSEALKMLAFVVPGRSPKPILQCVKISAGKKDVRICATDLEVGAGCMVPGDHVEQKGEIVIPADRLAAIVRESTDETLLFEAKEGACEITGADSHFTLYGTDPTNQYPQVPEFEGDADVKINLGELQRGVGQCLFATAKESTRYALNSVLWEMKGKKLSLAATDGRRLAQTKVKFSGAAEKRFEKKVMVSAKTMRLLEKTGGSDDEVVSIKLVDNQILFSCANIVISSNLVEGNFPKYEDIIPTDHDKKLTLSTSATMSAVRRAALLADKESNRIKLAVGDGKIIFSGMTPDVGDARIELSIEYKGGPIEIGLDPKSLMDFLGVVGEAEFELELGRQDQPVCLRAEETFCMF